MDPAPPGAMPSMASTLRAPVSGVCPVPESGYRVYPAPPAYLRRAAGGGMDPAPSASAVAYPDRASLDCPGRTCSRHG